MADEPVEVLLSGQSRVCARGRADAEVTLTKRTKVTETVTMMWKGKKRTATGKAFATVKVTKDAYEFVILDITKTAKATASCTSETITMAQACAEAEAYDLAEEKATDRAERVGDRKAAKAAKAAAETAAETAATAALDGKEPTEKQMEKATNKAEKKAIRKIKRMARTSPAPTHVAPGPHSSGTGGDALTGSRA